MSTTNHLSETDFKKWTRRVTPQVNDVVFSYETRLGEASLIPPGLKCCLGRRMALMRPDLKKVDPKFLLYAYLGPDFQDTIRTHTVHGSTVDRILLTEFPSYPITIPPLDEQKAIAHILGTLDDKIELNQQMNRTLEGIARAIFKSWFIDFDPVRAKMDQRQPAGMDAETAALFPDEFEDSPLGQIPKGWEVLPFEKLFFIPLRNGLTKPKRVRGSGTYMVNMGELFANRRIGNIVMDRVPLTESEHEKSMLQEGDLLFARQSLVWSGAGQCSIVTKSEEERTFESHLIRCRIDTNKADPWFYFYYFWSPDGRGRVESLIEQVAAAGIRGSDLAKLQILVPSPSLQRQFKKLILSLERRIAANQNELQTLTIIRDTLLPKLLSGEIRVKDAEKVLEEVA